MLMVSKLMCVSKGKKFDEATNQIMYKKDIGGKENGFHIKM